MKVAIIYDDKPRPETSGFYCRRAIEGIADVIHARPHEIEGLPRAGVDLYLFVDDDGEYPAPTWARPRTFWAIDTHLGFERRLARARDFDWVYAAQKNGAERLRREGVASAEWLPLACDAEIHGRCAEGDAFDVAFVGNVFPGPRADLLRILAERFPKTFVGNRYFEEMARVYSKSKIVFNRSIRDDVNMRVFEGLCSGSLLVTNAIDGNGQEELFRDGVELVTYRDAEELTDKVGFYLQRDGVRRRIAAQGRETVLAKHTYRHRIARVLEKVNHRPTQTSGACMETPPSGSGPDPLYFDLFRPEIFALVPTDARRVLDIGCGAGRLGQEFKRRQDAEVVGVEFDPRAAARARQRLDHVFEGDVERLSLQFEAKSIDVVICADVLEHLRHPERFLTQAQSWLRPGGVLVASIPNVRFHSVVRSLLDGNWTYESAGLLDQDHVRFFTRRDFQQLLEQCGFVITETKFVPGPGHDEWVEAGRPDTIDIGRLCIQGIDPAEGAEFFAYQFLVTATPAMVDHNENDDTSWQQNLSKGARRAPPLRRTQERQQASAAGAVACLEEEAAPNGRHGRSTERRVRRMRFTQDFRRDFEEFDFRGEPFAFVRFGDGERSICEGRPVVTQDAWSFEGGATRFGQRLREALTSDLPGYYIGISDGCCDRASKEWCLRQVRVPLSRLTFANIFVNANYHRFRSLDLGGMAVVSSGAGDFIVPEDCVNGDFDLDNLVDQLLDVDRPILVAAGPASCVIVHEYWRRTNDPQPIVDVGSAIDEMTKGRKTRPYQHPGSRFAELVCQW